MRNFSLRRDVLWACKIHSGAYGIGACTIVAFCLIATKVVLGQSGVTYYVRSGATGAATGLDWTNAFPVLPATLTRGATYYVADGNYPSYAFSTPVSGNTPITIKKATVAEHGTAAGWADAYGDGTAAWQPVTFNTSYWIFDGATGGGPGNWTSGFGFTFTNTACTHQDFIDITAGLSGFTIRHAAFTQTGNVDTCTLLTATHAIYPLIGNGEGTISSSLFEYLYFNNLSGLPFLMRGGSGNTIQYTYSGHICGMSIEDVNNHCEWAVLHEMSNSTIRWNYIGESPSSGGIVKNDVETSDGINIYGNVIRNGLPITCNTGTCSNWRVFNNTFATNIRTGPVSSAGTFLTTLMYNNITYGAVVQATPAGITHDYNWYGNINSGQCHMGAAPHENITVTSSCDAFMTDASNLFVNGTGTTPEDFKLRMPIANYAGKNLCSMVSCANTFNLDAFGNLRGADGVWDLGASELVAMKAPTRLRIVGQ